MMQVRYPLLIRRLFMSGLLALAVSACDAQKEQVAALAPVGFESGDECHVCGMIILEFPGPKGEVIELRNKVVRKFCSTRDLLSWWLQPENKHLKAEIYVHDMASSDWAHPDDRHLIDARKAYYVIGSDLQGSMGPTLASFASEEAAQKLMSEHGGKVLHFDEINLDVLSELMSVQH